MMASVVSATPIRRAGIIARAAEASIRTIFGGLYRLADEASRIAERHNSTIAFCLLAPIVFTIGFFAATQV